MADRTCGVCGVDISHKQRNALYCSHSHASAAAARAKRKRQGKGRRDANCEFCGVPFVALRSDTRFCSNIHAVMFSYRARREAERSVHPVRYCEGECGAIIERGARSNRRFCTPKCRMRVDRLRRFYNLSPAAFDAMVSAQRGCCDVCREPVPDDSWHIDHCHKSGAIRGLLCQNCNLMLGHSRDNPENLQKAISYLIRWGKQRPLPR